MIKILITGDFVARVKAAEVIKKGDYPSLFNDSLPLIREADIAITNLESPLLETGTPIAKTGANIKSSIKCIEAIKFAGFDMVTLANNHALDYGAEGLASTIKQCDKYCIRHIGAGSNLEEAKGIQYFNVGGVVVSFINCCENEWSTTHGDEPGCNPLDEISVFYQIQEAKSKSDHLILIVHGGHETYDYPSPRMKRLYRWFVDLGVDAVIGHHTHCFSGYEIYKNKPIVYSLGNFIFDGKPFGALWNVGAIAVLAIDKTGIGLNLHPYRQCDEKVGVHLFSTEETKYWLEQEYKKIDKIKDDNTLQSLFDSFVASNERMYRAFLEPNKSRWILAAKNRGLLPRTVKGEKRLLLWNIIKAESHRDIILELLSKEDNGKCNKR